jgi:DNA-binding SARP family transcriptional activator/pimeloyl-ACP methyl ester carboxylesterase
MRVEGSEGDIALASAKERSLLGALALRAGDVVSADQLVWALWGDDPPPTARKVLQSYVSSLRRLLGPGLIATEDPGYVLRVPPDDVDVSCFRSLVREGGEALRGGSVERARALFSEALTLWKGDPFTTVAPQSGLAVRAVSLKEEYLAALEARTAAQLECGCDEEVVASLEVLTGEHPFRERLWGQLMVALYRCGRQADALATYQRARRLLQAELGLEPSEELRRLEHAVLSQDASLDAGGPMSAGVAGRSGAGRDGLGPDMSRSPVRYALCDDGVHIAYQVVGDGPVDILIVPDFVCHLDLWWDEPVTRLVRRLATFSRVILFDKRGTGLSDRPPVVEVDHWVDDVHAVLDGVGSERTVLLGVSCGSNTAARFCAAHPERVAALIMYAASPRFLVDEGYDVGVYPEAIDSFIPHLEANWGTGVGLATFAPSAKNNRSAREYFGRFQRLSASPAAAGAFFRAIAAEDVRSILPQISAPTLVLHATRDPLVPVEAGRLVAALIPGATFAELDSDVHLLWLSDVIDDLTREVELFVTRAVATTRHERILTTVLQTTSPQQRHRNDDVAELVARHNGRMQQVTGQATFDSPSRAIQCAFAIATATGSTRHGVGVHSGECEVLDDGEVAGVTVELTSRLAALAAPGEVLVSRTVKDLLAGSPIEFEQRGRHQFENIAGECDAFAVNPGQARP